jgi:O-antigen ligase/polysaccharide polymerase Wzy-like membrane protein
MTALTVVVYVAALAVAAVLIWRRPVAALYVFVVGLAAHNLVMALLYGAGVHGRALTLVAAWKEVLLLVAVASVAWRARRERRLPFDPGIVDALALAFAAVVVVYAVLPQGPLGGDATADAAARALRALIAPVAAYFLGRSLVLDRTQLRPLGWTIVGTGCAVAAFGLADVYLVSLDWWRSSGAVGWFRDQLGFDYGRGLSGLPENFVFNAGNEQPLRRLVSTFLSPLATGFMLAVSILVATRLRHGWWAVPLLFAGLLWTHSRSIYLALGLGFLVMAAVARRWWPVAAAVAVVAIGAAYVEAAPHLGVETRFTPAELAVQRANARAHPGAEHEALSTGEPSIASHLRNLRDGLERVARHPQGYGLGNAGAVAKRSDVPILAGESNYTEIGVQTGLLGLALFVAWSLALLVLLGLRGRAVAAAALATVLALAVQTDAYGVPWLGYVVWAGCGALLGRATLEARWRSIPASTSATST